MGCRDGGPIEDHGYIPVPSREALISALGGRGAMVRFGWHLAVEITALERNNTADRFEIVGHTLDGRRVTGTVSYASSQSGRNRAYLAIEEKEEAEASV